MVKEGGKIDQHLDLIAGLPEEDYDSFRKTFNDVFAIATGGIAARLLKTISRNRITNRSENFGYTYVDIAPYEILV